MYSPSNKGKIDKRKEAVHFRTASFFLLLFVFFIIFFTTFAPSKRKRDVLV